MVCPQDLQDARADLAYSTTSLGGGMAARIWPSAMVELGIDRSTCSRRKHHRWFSADLQDALSCIFFVFPEMPFHSQHGKMPFPEFF
jgi:hypothetical protein